jgi:hypothetical protein
MSLLELVGHAYVYMSSRAKIAVTYRDHPFQQFAHHEAKHPAPHENRLRNPHRDSQQSGYVTDPQM